MKRSLAVTLAVLALLFAAITLMKTRTSADAESAADVATAAEKERLQRFWEAFRLATEYRTAGEVERAAAEYERALDVDGAHENSLYYLGSMYLEMGELAEAEKMWRRLVEVNPNASRAHQQLGALRACPDRDELFEPEAAEIEFRRALEINKSETGPLLRLGELALIRGDYAEARDYFDTVIGSNYSSVDAHFLMGYIAWKEGDARQASAMFVKAVEYARPEESEDDVPGEGDTEAGSAPLLSGRSACQIFTRHTADLAELDDAELPNEMTRRYRSLDGVLEGVRTRL